MDDAERQRIRNARPATRARLIADIRHGFETARMIADDVHNCRRRDPSKPRDDERWTSDQRKEPCKLSMLSAQNADLERLLSELDAVMRRKVVVETSAIYADLAARSRIKQDEERRLLVRHREELEAVRHEWAAIAKLISLIRSGRLDERAITAAQIAARSERDRERQTRIQTTSASANRRLAALKAQRATGKPTGPLNPEKARKEAERVRKLDARAADIRASTNAKLSDIRAKIGK